MALKLEDSCFVSKVLKVVGDDGSKEAPPKNISLCALRSHHSPNRKLSSSRARSLPSSFVCENLQSPLLGSGEANRESRSQEWKLSSKAEFFLRRDIERSSKGGSGAIKSPRAD